MPLNRYRSRPRPAPSASRSPGPRAAAATATPRIPGTAPRRRSGRLVSDANAVPTLVSDQRIGLVEGRDFDTLGGTSVSDESEASESMSVPWELMEWEPTPAGQAGAANCRPAGAARPEPGRRPVFGDGRRERDVAADQRRQRGLRLEARTADDTFASRKWLTSCSVLPLATSAATVTRERSRRAVPDGPRRHRTAHRRSARRASA